VSKQSATVIGKIEIIWKSRLGETGRLQTAPLERKVPSFTIFLLSLSKFLSFFLSFSLSFFLCFPHSQAVKAVDVELKIRDIPQRIVLETPFTVRCEILNRSDRPIQPQLFFNQSSTTLGIMGYGISGMHLERLEPGKEISVPLMLLPIRPGVQKISGLRVTDLTTERAFEFKDIVDVFIETA
jgi:hypothetical protein